jgi:hypothetical protein
MRIDVENNVFTGTIVANNDDVLFISFINRLNQRVNIAKSLIEKSRENDELIDSPKNKGFFSSFTGPKWSKEEVRDKFISENISQLDNLLKVEEGYDLFIILKTLEAFGIDIQDFDYLITSLDSTRLTFLYYCSQRAQKFHNHNENSEEGLELPVLSDSIFNISMINRYLADIKQVITQEGQTFVKDEIEEFLQKPSNPANFDSTWHILTYMLNKIAESSKSYGTISQNYIEELFYKAEMDKSVVCSLITKNLGDLVFKQRIHEVFNLNNTENLVTVDDVSFPMWAHIHFYDYTQQGNSYDEGMIRDKIEDFINKNSTWLADDFNVSEWMDIESSENHSKCILSIQSLVNLDEIRAAVDKENGISESEEA